MKGFIQHELPDGSIFYEGALPNRLRFSRESFEEVWALHPPDFHQIMMRGKLLAVRRWQQAYGHDYRYTGRVNRALETQHILEPFLAWTKDSGETCDDGNSQGGDGCSAGCRREPARFLSWDYVVLADDSLVARGGAPTRFGGPAVVEGKVVLSAPGTAFAQTEHGLRYFFGERQLVELPRDANVASVGSSGLSGVACYLSDQGRVWCPSSWEDCGYNGHFKPGSAMSPGPWRMNWCELQRSPGEVAGLSGSLEYGCILMDDGSAAQCWNKDVRSPKMSLGRQRQATQIATGLQHVCVLLSNGEIGCWGDASFGQLGYMGEGLQEEDLTLGVAKFVRRTPPTKFLKFDSPARQVLASNYVSCAFLENSELWCWGTTDHFSFRDQTEPAHSLERMHLRSHPKFGFVHKPVFASTMPSSPLTMPEDCEVADVTLISTQLCVVCKGGCGKCWGNAWKDEDESMAPRKDCLTF